MRHRLRVAVLLSIAIALSCGPEERSLNLVIIGIDTLRADHLGCYGYGRSTSPNIDRLAARGVVAKNAISQAPWTLPSFATVFTSLYPTQHGASTVDTRMRTSFPTLATMLRDRGYLTCAIVNAPVLRPEFGVDRGFDAYDVMPPEVERRADEVTREALKWIDEHHGQPFFVFVHYFDPHLSYSPPHPYDTVFDHGYEGPLGASFDLDYFSSKKAAAVRDEIGSLSAPDSNHIVALYDGEIAFTDSAVGVLLDGLEERGLGKNTLIVLLSDHGEEFFDHGGLDHGHSLYNELLHVPLIFCLPGHVAENAEVSQYVRLLDVLPTALDIMGLDLPGHLEGTSLKPLVSGEGGARLKQSGLVPLGGSYSEALRRNMTTKSVIVYPLKLIYDTATREEMVFNLEDDPGETQNLSERGTDRFLKVELMMFQALAGLSDTWYIKMAGGGDTHTFDLEMVAEGESMLGAIHLLKALNADGRPIDLNEMAIVETGPPSGSVLKIEDLETDGELTLALKIEPRRIPLTFDLRIDGKPAIGETYLGEALANPGEMPFRRRASGKILRSERQPRGRALPPYFLVWHTEPEYKGDAAVKLDGPTMRELRALGYIQ